MHYLAAIDTVHTAAALCDYLGDRVDADDEVLAVTVHDADAENGTAVEGGQASDAERDRQEALNVIGVRLAVPEVETLERRGDPAEEILAAATDRAIDEILLGARAGTPDASERARTVGSTAAAVLAAADRPVVVLPSAAPSS